MVRKVFRQSREALTVCKELHLRATDLYRKEAEGNREKKNRGAILRECKHCLHSLPEMGGGKMKRFSLLMVTIFILLLGFISGYGYAQSTLTLQKECAEGAKNYVSDITVQHSWECHYNKRLDKCFVEVCYFKTGSSKLR